jgi:hypothetical protein
VLKDGKLKPTETLKRDRSGSLLAATQPQRVPTGPARATQPTEARSRPTSQSIVNRLSARLPQRVSRVVVPDVAPVVVVVSETTMDLEGSAVLVHLDEPTPEFEEPILDSDVDVHSEPAEELEDDEPVRIGRKRAWPEMSTGCVKRARREVEAIREVFTDDVDNTDPTMVSEYAEEIFEYMEDLEKEMMPNADYIDGQTEVTWEMRETLVDWLLQVHLRYHMLPETLWIAINLVDRFLSRRVVSVAKLQLVGVTAMLVASKYEEILAPSVDEFVFLCEQGYSREEILKGEAIVLQTLDFRVSEYCSPYSWMRKISKADDYDIQTRTLAKFTTELTLLDHRFLAVKPSLVAAVGMYTARRMLGGTWTDAFVFHSGYTEAQLAPGHRWIVEKLCQAGIERTAVCKKYAHKKFLKASAFAMDWARVNADTELDVDEEGSAPPSSDAGMLFE